ncbi:hypothetical protein [Pseudomonas sp. Irchel s3a12]|uniref:hypothetical protein n=1 Tax=Pseudomonas sp. Irchel s3a12 TaxID=2009047 RepID=UPI000BA3EF7F|nr:hypothetical protein [Pseudomonas sp. Irchel s3a12]
MVFPLVIGSILGGFAVFFIFLCVFAFSPEFSQLISPLVIAVLKDVGGPVAAGFGGAMAGAGCSYFLQQRTEKANEVKLDFSVVHRSVIHLTAQLNDLFSIKKYNIYPVRDSKIRFLEISKIAISPSVTERVDPRIIDIALSVGDTVTIDTIYLAEARYRACFENFSNRNLVLDEYRATLKAAGVGKSGQHTLCEAFSVVGEGQLIALHNVTEQMIEVLDETLQSLIESLARVSGILDKKYKGTGNLSLKMNTSSGAEYLEKMPSPFFSIESLRECLNRCE